MPPVTVVFHNDDGTSVAVRPKPRPLPDAPQAGQPQRDPEPSAGPLPDEGALQKGTETRPKPARRKPLRRRKAARHTRPRTARPRSAPRRPS